MGRVVTFSSPLFLFTSTANLCRLLGHTVTQPWPSCAKLGYFETKDATKPKYYLIRSCISESALQLVTASLTILPLLSEATPIQATSTLSIWWFTAGNKHLLVLPDCSTLKSRNNHVSAQDQSSDRQVKAPFYYVQTQFILGEVKTMISSLNSYFN